MEGAKTNRSSTEGGAFMNVPLFITAAHELKSPLALMRQLSLALESGDCSPEEIARISQQITLTSERALRLTTDLTRTSRLEDSLFTLEPVNPLSLCEEVIEEVWPLYQAKGRSIELEKRSRPLLALANKDLLRRILLNFADNALHYSAHDAPVVVSARSFGGGERVRLGVRDYGPALPSDLTFGQSLQSRPESSGLGMFIVKQFAETMQSSIGTIRHRDGATFYVDVSASTQMRLL